MIMKTGLYSSAIEAIGNKPLVNLARITRKMDGRILAKLEYLPAFHRAPMSLLP